MATRAFAATLDRFGHSLSGAGRLVHTAHISGHAVSSFYVQTPARLGRAVGAPVCPVGDPALPTYTARFRFDALLLLRAD
jgi:hypothetical protein